MGKPGKKKRGNGKGRGVPIGKRFAALCQIVRAQHFAWREACLSLSPDADPLVVVRRMWEATGRETAKAYLKRIDRAKPLAAQVASLMVQSSRCMGEEACVQGDTDGGGALVYHAECPWFDWHRRMGALAEDRPGCDRWFESTVAQLNKDLGARLRVETLGSLPDGDPHCLRRIWEEEEGPRAGGRGGGGGRRGV